MLNSILVCPVCSSMRIVRGLVELWYFANPHDCYENGDDDFVEDETVKCLLCGFIWKEAE